MNDDGKRIYWIDTARSIAIIFVVLCHSVEFIYSYSFIEYNSLSLYSNIYKVALLTFGRLGVPLFLFITGCLILSKPFTNENSILRFYKNNCFPLLISFWVWNIVYMVFGVLCLKSDLNLNILLQNLIFCHLGDFRNIWYMPMILGLYLALPFVAKIINDIPKIILVFIILLNISVFLIIPTVNILFQKNYRIILDLSFFFFFYGVYLILGYLIHTNKMPQVRTRYYFIVGVMSMLFTIYSQVNLQKNDILFNVWYNYFPLFIAAFCLFNIIKRLPVKSSLVKKISLVIAGNALGIYYLHYPLLFFFRDILLSKSGEGRKGVTVIILFLASFFVSLLLSFILSKNKIIKKYIIVAK